MKPSVTNGLTLLASALLLLAGTPDDFGAWHQPGDWYAAGDAMVDPNDNRRLAGKPGTGVLINGKTGRTPSLVTKRRDFRDVEMHLEFMVAKGSNSGVIFHGLYEIQIHDSHGIKQYDAGHCGGIYPRAESKPKYHRIDKGFPAKTNAAEPPGEWQTLDIIFQAPRFDKDGKKTAHAKFVKVTLNGQVIHANLEVPYPTGTMWRKKQVPRGPLIIQGDYGPVALRNVRVRPWTAGAQGALNVSPKGFTARRPNVVLLLVDDLGWQDIGCYGGPVKTPTLDTLAAKGARFTDFHSGCAVCSPSRATFLTGRHHMRTGIYHVLQDSMHNAHLLEREVTIAEVLKQAGYATAHFGKWHLGLTSGKRRKPSPAEHGFDYWFGLANGASPSQKDPVNFIRNGKRVGPMKGYSCQIVVDDAIRWLNGKTPDRPFLLNIWFNEPHSVLAAPDEIVARYGGLKDQAALYSGAVENTDRAIASLVAKLKEMGELENTLIIYSSDNGSYRKDRNGTWRGSKGSNFEGGIRSPGIFYWPRGIKGGRVEKEPSGAVDLLPTICGLLGIEKPKGVHLDGADLSPLLTGRGEFRRHQPLFWYLPTSYPAAMIRDGRYTFMAYRDYKLSQDQKAMEDVYRQIEKIVGKDSGKPGEGNLRNRIFNSRFDSAEANRLRFRYVQLNTFQESWIPLIKASGFDRFGLYDLETDPKQEKDISVQKPEVVARLKRQLLAITADVMADAPDWSIPGKSTTKKRELNVPPEGFTALFNGKDFTNWRMSPKVKEMWSIEEGVLKSHGLLKEWGADLATEKHYRDFVLMLEFRMPTISDSGINFRRLTPLIPGFGNQEQFNLRSRGGMGHLESYYFLPKETARKHGLKEEEKPHVKHIDPEVGVWHKVKLAVRGRTITTEFDGEVLLNNFKYHDWMINMEPAPIRLQKHIVVHGQNLGKENPCPIEYRNIFIREIGPSEPVKPRESSAPLEKLLIRIDENELPKAYNPRKHQDYVDRRMADLSGTQRARIGQLWREKQRIHPDMPNRGASFVRILEYVAANVK